MNEQQIRAMVADALAGIAPEVDLDAAGRDKTCARR